MRILVIDDDPTSRSILSKLLASYGDCDTAQDGAEALEMFNKALQDDNKYDLLCLDIMMPKLDGQEVLKEVRKTEDFFDIIGSDSVKIIMTTALNDFENVKKSFREQCEAYLIKPIEKQKLIKALKQLELID